jgi:hypothetical protein
MKEWKCVEVKNHKDITEIIEDHQKNGWSLHTFNSAGYPGGVIHYLLFQREVPVERGATEDQSNLPREMKADEGRLARTLLQGRVLDLGELADPEVRKKFFENLGKKKQDA